MTLIKTTIIDQANEAKKAAKKLAALTTETKNEALLFVAEQLEAEYEFILAANEKDLQNGREKNFDEAFMDRLALNKERVFNFAGGLRKVAALPDPVGDTVSNWTLDNGLDVQAVRVPLGVIGMIYEARPNVTADATGLALKSGNAIVLKGGSSAVYSNEAIVDVMHRALEQTSIPKESVQFIDSTDRSAVQELLTLKKYIDVLIPRGGASLINTVVNNATVPVLETGVGNCHLYIDEKADVEKAINILVNAKTDRPAVCNAIETVIVHENWLAEHQDAFVQALQDNNIAVFGDKAAVQAIPGAQPAAEDDWANEYLSLSIAVKVVSHMNEAIDHINQYGTKHSEAIVTENGEAALQFMNEVDAAALYHNASTRFTDGEALGFGAEIGISTQKLHARGPVGLPALTTTKYMMRGDGQVR